MNSFKVKEPMMEQHLKKIHEEILETYDLDGGINHVDGIKLPSDLEVIDLVRKLMNLLFPGFFTVERVHAGNLRNWSGYLLDQVQQRLTAQVTKSICFGFPDAKHEEHQKMAHQVVLTFLSKIPKIRRMLKLDVIAAYMGDPAAKTHEEVIVGYPAIQAISMYRIAHELYLLDVPLLPRMITEYSHSKTGVDIHPGATIGESFFIDHGTGVVIGETCQIGNGVKIYQGVTLGALSFRKNENGEIIKGLKRHPTIEDEVILYAGCNILGGETVIGRGSVIGGNVWITESVEAYTVISFDVTKQEYNRFQRGLMWDSELFKGSGI